MAFSIFNRSGLGDGKKATPENAKPGAKSSPRDPAKAAANPKIDFAFTSTATPGRSSSGSSSLPEMMAYEIEELPLLQEVSVLYAADEMDAAQAMLKKVVHDKTPSPQAWLMLLDLYKVRSMKRDFEDLAMTYTVKFERSPPTWNEQDGQPETRKESRSASDFFTFQGKDDLLAEVKKMAEFAQRVGSIRIDMGKLKAVNPEAAQALAQTLIDFRKRELPVRFSNPAPFTDLLKKTIAEHPSKDYSGVWQLLFELYQRQGMQGEFEDLGLEYAMGFEMSPPSWESVPVTPAATADGEQSGDAEPAAARGFPISGVVRLDNPAPMQQMMNHAASHTEVHINMQRLQRIEFAAVGMFIDGLSNLNAAGKKIVLIDVNELVFPLLEAFGVNRVAILLRRKA